MSQAEVARRTGCPKSNASRVMKTLRESGVLDFDAVTRLYTPGIRLFENSARSAVRIITSWIW
ncbi:helix-turn-helix domain-containing protein (plasmid) [Neorhizobium galegae]|nr:helix-turn-helix domain-containing protein [Neorhizobium galegae]